MGTSVIGGTRRVNYGQTLRVPQRLKRRERRMKSKKPVEINYGVGIPHLRFRDGDPGTQIVISTLAVRHHHI
jgi:hypothetical protein